MSPGLADPSSRNSPRTADASTACVTPQTRRRYASARTSAVSRRTGSRATPSTSSGTGAEASISIRRAVRVGMRGCGRCAPDGEPPAHRPAFRRAGGGTPGSPPGRRRDGRAGTRSMPCSHCPTASTIVVHSSLNQSRLSARMRSSVRRAKRPEALRRGPEDDHVHREGAVVEREDVHRQFGHRLRRRTHRCPVGRGAGRAGLEPDRAGQLGAGRGPEPDPRAGRAATTAVASAASSPVTSRSAGAVAGRPHGWPLLITSDADHAEP